MGGCFSDTRGGQQAVGGAHRSTPFDRPSDQGHNDAVDHFMRSRGLHALFTQIELSFSASKLRDLDVLSKSDPMAVVFAKKRDGTLEELGRTEVIMNTLNPVWISKITTAYQFEIIQPLMLKLNEQDFLGEATCALSEIVTKHSKSLTLNLRERNEHRGMKNLGTFTIKSEETMASRTVVELVFRCSDLDNKDLFSKSDPFLRISRPVESGGSVPICKTEVDTPLIIECFDFNNNGRHSLIGKLQKSLAELQKLNEEKAGTNFYSSAPVQNDQKLLKGQLFVDRFCEKVQYSFLDYISSGFELNFMVAIDFTASNGNPRLPDSLHYIDPSGRLNAYQQAIVEVGEVIQFYDSDRRFPAWGFGGRPIDGPVEGIQGIMSAYASALYNVSLAGPTLFGHVINKAAQIASRSLSDNQTKYFVLLIITDGVITDLQETKDAIVKASDLPLSILVVGVGGADFKEMEALDADNGQRLESLTGRIATRDIVQFVPMREVQSGQISIVHSLLEELPGQFLAYMRSRDIKPPLVTDPQTSGSLQLNRIAGNHIFW
ncbi:protein BONZAI 3 [Cinnamomum micranthum f. kanehirae]|uniref:Protein BONZAI 3 n=1 Tax=Cinnamomum micranthum f. kanehirae TaxID=337451 RepID=A0A3S3NGI1_9MAGN|nr:protein BONZAI 3 [Cinnamomum micranthum f. kanehirae]